MSTDTICAWKLILKTAFGPCLCLTFLHIFTIRRWLNLIQPPIKRVPMIIKPEVGHTLFVVKNFFTPSECQKLPTVYLFHLKLQCYGNYPLTSGLPERSITESVDTSEKRDTSQKGVLVNSISQFLDLLKAQIEKTLWEKQDVCFGL